MNIIGWIIWGVALIILVTQIALFFHHDPGVGRLAKRYAFLITIELVVTMFTKCSKLHLLWWIPVSFFLNMFFFASGVNLRVARYVEQMQKKKGYLINQAK